MTRDKTVLMQQILQGEPGHLFAFTCADLLELLAGEFARGWNECSDAFKLDAQIVPDGDKALENYRKFHPINPAIEVVPKEP